MRDIIFEKTEGRDRAENRMRVYAEATFRWVL